MRDFREELGPRDRAGLEAVLEASGLLDAWVTPDGRLLDPHAHDVIAARRAGRHPAQPGAGHWRRSGARRTGRHRMGKQPGSYVCSDGRWRLGPLHGA
ncbi:hypothetical protein ACGF0J_19680 [Nonomuraea sp. NPDC047897]|uniref:hypothetical protein n=1 Tax=Nonomuraea sp. NPDC047897 TaxID=3364346 RepID=UPI003714B00A